MQLIKTGLLNSIAVSIKLLTLLGLNKILAVYVGPAGYATIGQFQNAVQVITSLSSTTLSTGVTKYTAQYYENEQRQHRLWKTAGTLALMSSVLTAIPIIIFNKPLALFFLKNERYSVVFICFAISLVFFCFNTLFLAVINGKKDLRRYLSANIIGSIFSLLITASFAMKYGVYGVLISLAVYQSTAFFITYLVCCSAPWFNLNNFIGRLNLVDTKNLLKYAIMSLASTVCLPISYMLVRSYLGAKLGWDAAGYWEAMSRLSSAYLMFVTTTLSVYYLPRLSELKTVSEIRLEVINGYKILLPVSIGCSILIYLFRQQIVELLFAERFSQMTMLFGWQMLGDTLKIISWLLSFIYVAKGYTRLYILSEVTFAFTFYFLVVLLENHVGLKAVSMAHAINYFFYLIFVFFSLKYVRAI